MKLLRLLASAIALGLTSVSFAANAVLSQYCQWSMGGGNASYGGVFDPSVVAAATGVATDLASTSSSSTTPTFSSSTYHFVAGDCAGHDWVFVAAGASWQIGLYRITSQSGNNCVVDAAIGHVILWNSSTGMWSLSTVAGCGATAGGTFSVCYSGPGQTADNVTNSTFGATQNSNAMSDGSSIFTPAMIGNAVHITTVGTNMIVGFYTITGYTSGTAVTVNAYAATAGAGSVATGYIGGSLDVLHSIQANTVGLCPVAGNWVWLSSNTPGANDTLAYSGSTSAPIVHAGYNTYWMDLWPASGSAVAIARPNGTGALPTTNMPLLSYTSHSLNPTGTDLVFLWFQATGSSGTSVVTLVADSVIAQCSVTNTDAANSAGAINLNGNNCIALDCDATTTDTTHTSVGLTVGQTNSKAIACRVSTASTNAAAYGMSLSANPETVIGNQVLGPGSGAIGIFLSSASNGDTIMYNTVVGYGDDCNQATGNTGLPAIINNMFTDSANGFNNVSSSNMTFLAYNRLRNSSANIATGSVWTTYSNALFGPQNAIGSSTYPDYHSSTDLRLLTSSPAVGNAMFPAASIGALQLSAASAPAFGAGYSQ